MKRRNPVAGLAAGGVLALGALAMPAAASAADAHPAAAAGCGTGTVTVIGDGVRVHTEPDTGSTVLGLLCKGQQVQSLDVCNVKGGAYPPECGVTDPLPFWAPITFSGRTGYFPAECATG